MRYFAILLILIFAGCDRKEKLEMKSVTILTHRPDEMINWYTEILDFEKDSKRSVEFDDFEITFSQPEDLAREKIDYQMGLFKIGFASNQFEELYNYALEQDANLIGGIFNDRNLKTRSFLMKDPDGNRIQIFESFDKEKLRPCFVAFLTPSVGEMEKWYQMKFPIQQTFNLDVPERDMYIRLLKGENIFFEIIQTQQAKVVDQKQPGIFSVEFSGVGTDFSKDRDGNNVIGD